MIRNLTFKTVWWNKHKQTQQLAYANNASLKGSETKTAKEEQTQQLSSTSYERTINNSTKAEKNSKNMIPTPCLPTQTQIWMNHPQPSLSPIICSNNTMIMILLVQWGNIIDVEVWEMMKYSTYIWNLVHGPLNQHPLPPARHQPHPLKSL